MEKKYNAGLRYDAKRLYPVYNPSNNFKVLTWQEWIFWKQNGYLIIPKVVDKIDCEELINVMWRFIEAKPENNKSWYSISSDTNEKNPIKSLSGMLEIYHHPLMWKNRQSKKIYETFEDIWGTKKLWVSIDRLNINLPKKKNWDFNGFLHWDIDMTKKKLPNNVQGVLNLNGSSDGSGGLQLIPRLFNELNNKTDRKKFINNDDYKNFLLKNITEKDILNVPSNSGDLIIWDSKMIHGTSQNNSKFPRFAQYISMVPAEPNQTELLKLRLESFENQTGPLFCGMTGSTREKEISPKPILSEHGEKILGKKNWL